MIGPIGAGKSTQAQMLAQSMGLPRVCLDDLRYDYYREIGYSDAEAGRAWTEAKMAGLYRYWKPFEAHAVERVISDHPRAVIDFGGGHSVYEDDVLFARVRAALAPLANIILLLPSPDSDASVRILTERTGPIVSGGMDFHVHFVRHHSNLDLATIVVYTEGQAPEETRDEILHRLRWPNNSMENANT